MLTYIELLIGWVHVKCKTIPVVCPAETPIP